MVDKSMSSKKQFPLRLDPKLYQALERWATDEFRSVNAHIEFLLRDAARRAGRLRDEERPRSADNAVVEPDPSNAE